MMMQVTIDRGELLQVLGYFGGMTIDRIVAEAQVYSTGVGMIIDCAGNSVEFAARGQWDGVARVPASLFIGLAERPPAWPELVMRVAEDRFYIGNTSAQCVVQPDPETSITVPLDPSLRDLLAVHLQHPKSAVENAGLKRAVDAAADKSSSLIRSAADILAPLGITAEHLADLLVSQIIRTESA
jgi:hypothetical protein